MSGRGRHAGAGATRRCRRGCAWSAGAAVARRQLVQRHDAGHGARLEPSPADLGQSRPLAAAAAPLLSSRATPRLLLSQVIWQSRSTRPSACSPGDDRTARKRRQSSKRKRLTVNQTHAGTSCRSHAPPSASCRSAEKQQPRYDDPDVRRRLLCRVTGHRPTQRPECWNLASAKAWDGPSAPLKTLAFGRSSTQPHLRVLRQWGGGRSQSAQRDHARCVNDPLGPPWSASCRRYSSDPEA